MNNRYIDLIEQTFEFPQDSFKVENDRLLFNEVPLMELVEKFGSPLRLTYLPEVSSQIQKARWTIERCSLTDNILDFFFACQGEKH